VYIPFSCPSQQAPLHTSKWKRLILGSRVNGIEKDKPLSRVSCLFLWAHSVELISAKKPLTGNHSLHGSSVACGFLPWFWRFVLSEKVQIAPSVEVTCPLSHHPWGDHQILETLMTSMAAACPNPGEIFGIRNSKWAHLCRLESLEHRAAEKFQVTHPSRSWRYTIIWWWIDHSIPAELSKLSTGAQNRAANSRIGLIRCNSVEASELAQTVEMNKICVRPLYCFRKDFFDFVKWAGEVSTKTKEYIFKPGMNR
jgi:hypothetical protein